MAIRFLTPTLHGVVDYTAAAALIVMPFVLGLGESHVLAKWLAVATGFAVIVVSLLTDYRYGAVRVLPFKGHLAIDAIVAALFLIAPFALGFSGLDAAYYIANALAVFAVVSLSDLGTAEPRVAAT